MKILKKYIENIPLNITLSFEEIVESPIPEIRQFFYQKKQKCPQPYKQDILPQMDRGQQNEGVIQTIYFLKSPKPGCHRSVTHITISTAHCKAQNKFFTAEVDP